MRALPARAGNAYQDVTISAMLTWGVTDTSGMTQSVLGERATRSAATASADSTFALTGLAIHCLLGIATALLGFDAACLAAAALPAASRPDLHGLTDNNGPI